MSVINPNETARSWRAHRRESSVQVYLSDERATVVGLIGESAAGFPLSLNIHPVHEPIDFAEIASAAAVVVQVDVDVPASVRRFERLAAGGTSVLIAAAYDPPLALVRSLVRAGAHDVVPLPLDIADLETTLAPLRDELAKRDQAVLAKSSKLVSVIKSVGGVGATALAGQLGIRFAGKERIHSRQACLIDLDVQFGDAAFQLGLKPKLSVADLVEAGSRLDGALLRSTAVEHSSGLHVIGSPPAMLPLEALTSEQAMEIVDLAKREYGTVFLDLPSNWTNWSLSLLAQSDLVLLVTELSVTSLHRARRQIELIRSQDLGELDVRVVVNRFEKSLLRTIKPADVREALGRDIAFTISNEPALMRPAIDQGVPIGELKRKSALGKDLDLLDVGIASALGLGR